MGAFSFGPEWEGPEIKTLRYRIIDDNLSVYFTGYNEFIVRYKNDYYCFHQWFEKNFTEPGKFKRIKKRLKDSLSIDLNTIFVIANQNYINIESGELAKKRLERKLSDDTISKIEIFSKWSKRDIGQ